ncbi:TIGR02281 family clan AA aspartic protease [Sphingomonas naasensis]|uniref:TIGR02281 family clan AA aspartic protease n=2 Tax=Sphingomonas naasensis TaxID=1344951 RepID=A0A4S1WW83_9SPHN|nr:TIGR02281 family clan AA aspartic protease [Sphingomonas naasensis]TGX46540.1 TIGR02281 family clan AA aspartic protease [Sphingomonas naasensis]
MDLIWLVGVLVLALSALSVRRLSFGLVLRSLISWALIIVLTVLAVAHRHEIGAMFAAASAKLGIDDQQVEGETVRIRMAPDGHFWARVKLNGVERRMLIDSGATITAISSETAAAAGIDPDNGLPALIETANGTVQAKRGTIQRLGIGPLETADLGVVVSQSFGDLDVLGMNFLSRLHSWRVENRTLILEPRKDSADKGGDATTDPKDSEPKHRRRDDSGG